MPKRAQPDDAIDPVRSRLAAAASAPSAAPAERMVAEERNSTPAPRQEEWGGDEVADRTVRKPKAMSRSRTLSVNRKIMVTEEEAARIEATAAVISASFGSKVTYSQVSRAMWSLLAGAEDEIKAGARRAPKLPVPSKGDHVAMAEYEEAIADFLLTALKRS